MNRRWPIPRLIPSRGSRARDGRGGDERFHMLILPHLEAAWNYARYLSRDANVAEDLVQDAFLRAFRGQDRCHGDGKAWLMAIVRNCWHDWLREHRRPEEMTATDFEAVDDATEAELERQSEARHLRTLLYSLPEPFRETLVLRELEELSYREIAETTSAPIGTVMSRLARGREMLATLVVDQDIGARKIGSNS